MNFYHSPNPLLRTVLSVGFSLILFTSGCGEIEDEANSPSIIEAPTAHRQGTELTPTRQLSRLPLFEETPDVEEEPPPQTCDDDADCDAGEHCEGELCVPDGPPTSCTEVVVAEISLDVIANERQIEELDLGDGEDPTVKYAAIKLTAPNVTEAYIYGNFSVRHETDEVTGVERVIPLIFDPEPAEAPSTDYYKLREVPSQDFLLCTPEICPEMEDEELFEEIEGDLYRYKVSLRNGSHAFLFEMSEERHQFIPVVRCGENPLEAHEGDDEESPKASVACSLLPWEKSPHIQVDMAVQKALGANVSVRYLSSDSDSEEGADSSSGSEGGGSGSGGTGRTFLFTLVPEWLSLLSHQTSSFDLDPSGVIAIDEVKRYVPIKKNRMEITCRASGITNTETVVHRVEIGPLPPIVEEDSNVELGESGFQLGGDFAFHVIPQTNQGLPSGSQGDDCDWRMIRWDFGNNPQDTDRDDDGGQCNATLLWQFAQDMKITQVSSQERVVGRYKTPWMGELKVRSYQTEDEAAINGGITCNDNIWSFKASDYTQGGILKEGNSGLNVVASNWTDPEPYNNAPISGGGRTGASQGFIIKKQKNVSRNYATCNRYKIKAKSFDDDATEQHILNLQYHSEFEVGDHEDIGSISNWCVNYRDGWGRGVTWRIPFEAQHVKEIDTEVYFWGCRNRPTLSEFDIYVRNHYRTNVCGWFKETRGEEMFYGSDFLGRDDWDLSAVIEALDERDPDVNPLSRTDWYEDLPFFFPGSGGEGYYISTRDPHLDGVKYYNFGNEYKSQGNIHPIAQPEESVPDEDCDPGTYNTVSQEERQTGGGGAHIKISNAHFRHYRVVMKAKGYDGRTLTRKRQFRISNRRFLKAPAAGEARGNLCEVDTDCYHYCEDPYSSRGPCEVCGESNLYSSEGQGHKRCTPWRP